MEGGAAVATAFLVAAFRFFVLAARLRADFSFRFRMAFFAADILTLRMGIPFASSYQIHSCFRHTMPEAAMPCRLGSSAQSSGAAFHRETHTPIEMEHHEARGLRPRQGAS